jgi:hypothetical protein
MIRVVAEAEQTDETNGNLWGNELNPLPSSQ